MSKRDVLVGSFAVAAISYLGFPTTAQSATASDGEKDIAKAKSAILSKDYPTALKLLKPLAEEKGMRPAEYHLALMYFNGEGVPKDPKKAAELFQKAADQGGPHAAYDLGLLYAKGEGVPQDSQKAFGLFRKQQTSEMPMHKETLAYCTCMATAQSKIPKKPPNIFSWLPTKGMWKLSTI